ncbi:hypothetical protein ACFV7R_35000 [Streptomyces sp. NPDC059866]|uniref:hypothetical protein n=1 Tax=Streptomyces sp. NPDC059866 TaxID=3346978 RepID=UPI0036495E60
MDHESGSHEPDEAEPPAAPSSKGADGRKPDAGNVLPPSYRTILQVSAGFRAMAEDVARTQRFINQAVAPLQHVIAESQRFQQMIRDSMPDLSFIAPRIDWAQFRGLADTVAKAQRVLERVVPSNWLGESLDYDAMPPILEGGTPLAWVPSAPIIRQLLAAPDAQARAQALEENTEEIVASCREALSAVSQPGLRQQAAMLEDCLTMVEASTLGGAQALAASVWDTVYRGVWRAEPALKTAGFFKYKDVAKKLPKIDLDDSTLLQFRQACVFAPFVKACEDFHDSHPVPTVFNRHATAHAAGSTQYSRANALTALMLAVSLLRELEQGDLSYSIRS